MAFSAASVMRKANTILQDNGAVRWTAMEMCDWLNDAMRAVVTMKPNALSGSVALTLVAGTRQTLPDEYAVLTQVVANLVGATGFTRGEAIRVVQNRQMLDSRIPNWHSNSAGGIPFAGNISYVLQEPMAPREFYVVPGAIAGTRIEAIVGKKAVDVPIPTSGNVLDVNAYTTVVEFDDLYQAILLDLLLFRAFSKDSGAPDGPGRSQNHLTLATNQLVALGTAQDAAGLATAFMAMARG